VKKCIWCKKNEEETAFNKVAHSVPKSLGGKNICQNVCDDCNSFFGNIQPTHAAIEETFKEVFNITRARILNGFQIFTNNKNKKRFKSRYFDVDVSKKKLKLKSAFRRELSFQMKFTNIFKRGLYKVYLEEVERQFGTAHHEKFDFVRQVARYGLDTYPLFYFYRNNGIIMMLTDEAENPSIFFQKMNYLYNNECYVEIEFMGHVFGFPINRYWELMLETNLKESIAKKIGFFNRYKEVKKISDIDLFLNIMDK
jgi:hypothetical protein